MAALDSTAELTALLDQWGREDATNTNVSGTLAKIAELFEKETESWYKMDPDPFDDRHPGKTDPSCSLGHMLKTLLKNDYFMNKLVHTYSTARDPPELNVSALRLLVDIAPGLDTNVVFQDNDSLVQKLIQWTKAASQPLQAYATGLLAAAMDIQDIAANHRADNAVLVPMMLDRMHQLKDQKDSDTPYISERPFAGVGKETTEGCSDQPNKKFKLGDASTSENSEEILAEPLDVGPHEVEDKTEDKTETYEVIDDEVSIKVGVNGSDMSTKGTPSKGASETPLKKFEKIDPIPGQSIAAPLAGKIDAVSAKSSPIVADPTRKRRLSDPDFSNSSWAEMEFYVIGKYQMHPLTVDMEQRLILQYLTPLGEYQELLGHVYEHKAMDLIFHYIDLSKNRDVRLAFEALKYLASLLCHKKFAFKFIQLGGVQKLLDVYRPSVAAIGVSLCLYYLAYFEDIMERVCMLPEHVLSNLVSYVLWLLECSHVSGRCHATMFFSCSFMFRAILELFDRQDGLRKLYNVISTLDILSVEDGADSLGDDEKFVSRQASRHVCDALKKYFEAHLVIKTDEVLRSHMRGGGASPLVEIPPYKAAKFSPDVIQGKIEVLLECLPERTRWDPVNTFIKLGGPQLLLKLTALAADASSYTGKAETIKNALDVLSICSVAPRTQLVLCEAITLPDNVASPALSILLGMAEGEILADPDIQKAALSVIANCVCGPLSRFNSSSVGWFVAGSAKKKHSTKSGEDLISKLWGAVRANNGIMVFLGLLMTKTPITEADSIRALACKVLLGLARSDTVRQIIGKLPLFNNGQLQLLMKEPVLQDKRTEHLKFCKYATQLLEKVSGKPQHPNIDASLERIRRADIVSQTKIIYHEKELLQLIHDHLMAKGLNEAASALQREADLPRCSSPAPTHPTSPHLYSPGPAPRTSIRQLSSPSTSGAAGSQRNSSSSVPIKINLIHSKVHSPTAANHSRVVQSKKLLRQKQTLAGPNYQSPLLRKNFRQSHDASLDKIVKEYLSKQHAVCPNPVTTCPPFSLFKPHRCPSPQRKTQAPTNFASRLLCRSLYPKFGGPDGRKLDRKFIYSRFRPVRSYRDTEEDGCFSCCSFSADEQYLLLGTYAGELKMFNVHTTEEAGAYVCHNSPLTHCQPSRDGRLVLTSSSWSGPLSAVWSMGAMFDMKHTFEEDNYLEFSKSTQDRIIGTKEETAHVYDTETGQTLLKLFDQDKANNYTANRATFSPTDDLVLNDGVLWDVNSGKSIHKFDKFNQTISGVFHPMGLEIIVNSEVWDLRTYHLLHTVPALDQCQIRFNKRGDVIYGAIHQSEDDDNILEDKIKSPFGSSIRTFDATEYSHIATLDVKKNIFDLCTDTNDSYLAVIENHRDTEALSDESLCRLYEVGKVKDEDDQANDDDDDDDENDDDNDDDDDDQDDDDDDDGEDDDEDGSGSVDEDADDMSEVDADEMENSDDDVEDEEDEDDDDDDDEMENLFFALS